MIALKKGVRIFGIRPEMVFAHSIVAEVYKEFDRDCIITSCTEGKHSKGSEHYKGDALDYRIRHLISGEAERIHAQIKERLGGDFDVVLEKTHIHIEFDPKDPY